MRAPVMATNKSPGSTLRESSATPLSAGPSAVPCGERPRSRPRDSSSRASSPSNRVEMSAPSGGRRRQFVTHPVQSLPRNLGFVPGLSSLGGHDPDHVADAGEQHDVPRSGHLERLLNGLVPIRDEEQILIAASYAAGAGAGGGQHLGEGPMIGSVTRTTINAAAAARTAPPIKSTSG